MTREPDDDAAGGSASEGVHLLAHDIRAAVSDVIGGVRLMKNVDLPPDARLQLDRVQSAGELLARLVEDLLAGSPGDNTFPVGNLNLRRFIDDELRRWHGAAQGTGITVKADRSGNVPEIVQLPLLPLRRVVANLMSNAMRHSGGDVITLACEMGEGETLWLCVHDSGRGFPKDFEPPRVQDDPPSSAKDFTRDGHGMGLHIAAAHAHAIGAELNFERSHLGGARVGLIIPKSVWSRQPEEGGQDTLPDLRGARLLVADDSNTNRLLVQAMLTRLGAECELARDGIEALNWLARERFDLALIDIEMPVLSGIDVLRSERMRQARGIAPPTSLIAMTAYVVRDNHDAILEAGADGILPKPLGSIEAFGTALQRFLATAPDASDWKPEAAPALSAATLSELMDAAGPAYQGDLLDRLREDLKLVERNLAEGLKHEDLEVVAAQTHVLLSLSSAIGALPTQASARRLNGLAQSGELTGMRVTGKVCLARLAQLREDLASAS